MAIPSQSTKLNVHQSVLVAILPNLMSAECTTSAIFNLNILIKHSKMIKTTQVYTLVNNNALHIKRNMKIIKSAFEHSCMF